MSKTDFNFTTTFPEKYLGFRLKPGAFFALTGTCATVAMDRVLPLERLDPQFNKDSFFEMELPEIISFSLTTL